MIDLDDLLADPRIRVRRLGDPPAEGRCVVYWMQRAQRALDNPALNVAIEAGGRLRLPVVVHFGLHPRFPAANARHYAFLASGLMGVAYWMAHGFQAPLPIQNHGEPAVLLCFIFLYCAAYGAGPWSVDGWFARRKKLA